ncbi:hypothetical protein CIPAW_02G026800 [Carya illinoinensis]|uniref:Secreted protein n=1 Tax=Carya illinoinensis TaxID=32201 RepID=A0A8T1R956_CARIL|nr:hypothetical protein CIPAW_02G026800 [Carya illinoinensis]
MPPPPHPSVAPALGSFALFFSLTNPLPSSRVNPTSPHLTSPHLTCQCIHCHCCVNHARPFM